MPWEAWSSCTHLPSASWGPQSPHREVPSASAAVAAKSPATLPISLLLHGNEFAAYSREKQYSPSFSKLWSDIFQTCRLGCWKDLGFSRRKETLSTIPEEKPPFNRYLNASENQVPIFCWSHVNTVMNCSKFASPGLIWLLLCQVLCVSVVCCVLWPHDKIQPLPEISFNIKVVT